MGSDGIGQNAYCGMLPTLLTLCMIKHLTF